MMFSLSCTLFILLAVGVSGQTNTLENSQPNHVEKGYPFGKLRLSEDGTKEELILSTDHIEQQPTLDQDQSSNGQPLPSPCLGTSPSTKLAFPKDKTKYIQCRDEFHYEILTCPNNSEYVERTGSCELTTPTLDRCEAEKPCLNDGRCSVLSNSTIKCTCRQDWTGERCETPLNSCVTKPCGPNADCRALKTTDSEQDYVCVCHLSKGYGLSCQEVVSNPCLTNSEQFFPYAFSQRAYVQCNGELIYFQPCGPSLYWDQEEKICDRKPPAKIETPVLITKVTSGSANQPASQINDATKTSTTTVPTEQESSSVQKGKEENEAVFAFVPARVANRQQLQSSINNQQSFPTQTLGGNEPKTSEASNQRFPVTASNQNRPDLLSNTNQWTNQQTDTTLRQPLTVQSNRQQQWPKNTVQQWAPKLVDGFSVNSNLAQSQTKQTFPQHQTFSNQQWSNQIPTVKNQMDQGSQSFPSQNIFPETAGMSQTSVRSHDQDHWQNKPVGQSNTFIPQQSQTFVNHPHSWQNQQSFLETTTIPSQGFQNLPEESWQSKPVGQSNTFSTQQSPSFVRQPHSWQNQNQQFVPETTTIAQTRLSFPSQKLHDQEQTWQTKPLDQSTGSQFSQKHSLNTQNFLAQPQSWQTSQTVQNQQPSIPTTLEATSIEKNNRVNTGIQQNTPWSMKPQITQNQQSWQTRGTNQFRQHQVQPESSMINTQQLPLNNEQTNMSPALQSQSWTSSSDSESSREEGAQSQIQQQQQQTFPQQNQLFNTQQRFKPQTFVETTTTTVAPTFSLSQNLQTPQQQDQPWQNQFITQQVSIGQPIKPQSNPIFAFKPKPWPVETQNLNDQNAPQTSQLWSQTQNQQSLISKPSTSQFSNPASQFTNLDDSRSTITAQSQPWSQTGKLTGNSFETVTTTSSKTPLQVLLPLSGRNWQSGRTNDQQTTDQRLPLDSGSTFSSGSWKSRS